MERDIREIIKDHGDFLKGSIFPILDEKSGVHQINITLLSTLVSSAYLQAKKGACPLLAFPSKQSETLDFKSFN